MLAGGRDVQGEIGSGGHGWWMRRKSRLRRANSRRPPSIEGTQQTLFRQLPELGDVGRPTADERRHCFDHLLEMRGREVGIQSSLISEAFVKDEVAGLLDVLMQPKH